MRLIDADELMKRLEFEKKSVDIVWDRPNCGNFAWHRKNEIVRVQGIVANMPTEEK